MNPKEVVYISNIPKQTSQEELHHFLSPSGNVVGSTFMRENRNDCRTKIAFVMFENEAQAQEACNLDQTLFQSHRLSVLLSNDDRKFLAGYTIVIENTSSDTSEEDLFEACCKYGNVEVVQIPTNYYAFVGFGERSAAHAAQRKLDNSMLKQQKVSVKVLNEDVRVRLEDLDSYKTPRVYNELLNAKQKYYNKQPSIQVEIQHNRRDDRNDEVQNQQYYDQVDDGSMCQANMNDANDSGQAPEEFFYEEEYNPVLVYRRDVRFGKPRFIPATKTTVKVENIPRDVYDEDVVIYFQQFGPIHSIEKGISINSRFSKIYMITYQDEEAHRRAINCIRRQVVLSNMNCTVFTMIPGEALLPIKSQCVLVSYVPNHILYDDIVEAFANIGDVLYVEKKVRNNGPTILHFTHSINMKVACQINCIAGFEVRVVPMSQKEFLNFTANFQNIKKTVKIKLKGTAKGDYLSAIESQEELEKSQNIIFKTAHNPHYRNPNPEKFTFEVAVYNCPKHTKFNLLKSYFKRAGDIRRMRHEVSKFDPNIWKVYVTFNNYLEAFRAVRLKGKLDGGFIFKHIAAESPKLNCIEAVKVKVLSDNNINVADVARGFIGCGGLYFAERVGISEFVVIFRDMKGAQKACTVKAINRQPIEVRCMKSILTKEKDGPNSKNFNLCDSSNVDGDGDAKHQRPLMLLSDLFAAQEGDKQKSSQLPEEAQLPKKEPPKPVIANDQTSVAEPKASTSSVQKPDSNDKDLRTVIAEKRNFKSECHGKLNDLEEMERYIKQKEQDIQRRLQQLERDEANVTALLPSSSKVRSLSPEEVKKEPSISNDRNSSTIKHSSQSRIDSCSAGQRANSHTLPNKQSYPSNKMIISEQMRAVSPSDRLAHERYMQIRVEKIAITQELNSLRQRFDYRKGSRVEALKDLLAGLNREQREIQLQLEAKVRFRMPDDMSYAGSSFDTTPPSRQQGRRSSSRSRSPYRPSSRSRSRSHSRRFARSRSRSHSRRFARSRSRSHSRRFARSRSRSPLRRPRVSRTPSPPPHHWQKRRRTRSPSIDSETLRQNRGYSSERDMYNNDRYNTKHGKNTVCVGNISSDMTQRELEDIFSRYGRLETVDFSNRTRSREVYFNYANRAHAFKALEMNDVKISGYRLRVHVV